MNSEIKNLTSCRRELSITIPKADLEPVRERQIKRVRKEVQFPGFRKGKAPLALVKKNYADIIEAYTLEEAVEESLKKAAEENGIIILGQAEAKKMDFSEDGDVQAVIEFDTHPEIELKEYKGLEFVRDKYIVTDKAVDESIRRMLKQRAEISTVDGPIEEGHRVVMDMQELDEDGLPIVGKSYKDITITMGEGRFDKDLEDQLYGLKCDDEKKIEKVYPEDYPQKEIAGKTERFLVMIKSVEKEELPVLDDEFVKDLGDEKLQTVDDLHQASRQALERQHEDESDKRLTSDMAQALVEKNSFEVPRVILDDYLDQIIKDVKQRDPKLDETEARQHYEPEALFNMKWHYLQQRIAEVENIIVDENDVREFLENIKHDEIRDFYKQNPQMMDRVREDILQRKIFEYLVSVSKIKDNEIKLD